jgi:hypothetical protein
MPKKTTLAVTWKIEHWWPKLLIDQTAIVSNPGPSLIPNTRPTSSNLITCAVSDCGQLLDTGAAT